MTRITAGLLEVLLEMAAEADPRSITVHLAIRRADVLGLGPSLPPEEPVFAEFYHPSTGASIEAVFGMDVSVPPAQTPGVFITHPEGHLGLERGDEFAERILVAIPPWRRDAVAVFDRRGREHPLDVVEAASIE